MTPRVIANLSESIEENLEYLDGYDELPEDLQGKVAEALAEGHVDDADWKGVSTLAGQDCFSSNLSQGP